ncbi:MAG: Transcriptional regulator, MerR family [uncultured Frankineae bacterium]|uniref:Transcriptional regulator, MerR family n=1 Tax=uncultured Frankineae bacterium TaxID=437475 RepID=A0A6J4MGD3_9ACTN|nr:MAG: Transcriptional regulator, MerR family [uncultured Frankineae bacterium]
MDEQRIAEGGGGSSSDASLAPRLTVAAVAHRLGVAPATLRTWARRYGLGPSEHEAGAHRRYTPADVARLQTMRRLTLEGVAPAEAARVALALPLVEPGPSDDAPLPDREGRLRSRRGGPGGRVLALPGADGAVRGLGRAAMALDAHAVTALVREEVARSGVLHTWDHVLRPVLVAVGARWAATGEGVEVEHLLSDCTAVVLREIASAVPELPGRRPVVLSCAPEEHHALPLHALAAGLAERGVGVRTLGPALPAAALQAAVRRTGPAALFVWSQLPGTADPAVLEALPVTRPPTAVVVGGPGWAPDRLPRRVTVAADLPHALELVDRALGA